MGFFAEILKEFIGSIAAWFFIKHKKSILIRFIPQRTLWYHKQTLLKLMSDLPFIYRDLDLNLVNSFVFPDIEPLNIEDLQKKHFDNFFKLSMEERIKRKRQVVLLGNAGMGKTTFLHKIIIDLLTNPENVGYFHPQERLVPIYIPLKVIDNTIKYPIIYYLTNSVPFFQGRFGEKLLKKFISHRRLFLILDGYDEISIHGHKNFIQEELNILFQKDKLRNAYIDSENKKILYSLSVCRIWLASRREFFELNPIAQIGDGIDPRMYNDIGLLSFLGIRGNRAIFVKNIFDRYRLHSTFLTELLNEELFLYQVDSAHDGEISSLSENPLFLTVLIYIYIKKVFDIRNAEIEWQYTVEELIIECIKLLISDVDEDKVRKLPYTQRVAIMHRRNEFPDEKLRFLQYFALNLYIDEKTVFDREYLFNSAYNYFSNIDQSPKKDIILRYIEHISASPRALTNQIIFSGIFVIVHRNEKQELYDFPHRRFRETLALNYLVDYDPKFLLKNLDKKHLSEFILVSFNKCELRDVLLKKLLEHTLRNPKDTSFGKIIFQALNNLGKSYDSSQILMSFLDGAINKGTEFRLPKGVLNYLHIDSNWIDKLAVKFDKAVEKDRAFSISLICIVLNEFNRPLLHRLIKQHITSIENLTNTRIVLLRYIVEIEPKLFVQLLPIFEANLEFFNEFAYCATVFSKSNKEKYYMQIHKKLKILRLKKIFAYWVHRNDLSIYQNLRSKERLKRGDEIIQDVSEADLLNFKRDEPDLPRFFF